MRILVGILYCGENEFDRCIESVESQRNVDFDYFVLRNLSNKEAHDTLYSTFMERASEFDAFVKVDADMVLCRDDLFLRAQEEFEKHPETDHLQILVDDSFTKSLIYGFNIYRSSVTWIMNDEMYFTDRVNNETNCRVYNDPDTPLVPAAYHCPDPSDFQSYHFGIHKAAKALNAPNRKVCRWALRQIRRLKGVYREDMQSRPVELALAGAIHVLSNGCEAAFMDYSSRESAAVFQSILSMGSEERKKYIEAGLVACGFALGEKGQLGLYGFRGGPVAKVYAQLVVKCQLMRATSSSKWNELR